MKPDIVSESQFCLPHLYSTPPLGGGIPTEKLGLATRWWTNFEVMFIRFDRMYERDRRTHRHTDTAWRQKLEWPGYHEESIVRSRFDTVPGRDRQTDGRTDRVHISISRVCTAVLTHDKNRTCVTYSSNSNKSDPISTICVTQNRHNLHVRALAVLWNVHKTRRGHGRAHLPPIKVFRRLSE